MGFQANVLRIMIASPGDVEEERRIASDVIHRWNSANAAARQLILLPVKWETHSTPEFGEHPQTIINRQILDEADILIGIFGTRIGTRTAKYVSGTVEEIKRHVAAGKTAMLYFSDAPVAPSSLDPDQYAALQQFKQECKDLSLYAMYNDVQQFKSDLGHHLDLHLNEPRYRWLKVAESANEVVAPTDISKDALGLVQAAASTDGIAVLQEGVGVTGLRIGPTEFMDGTPRSDAKWRKVVQDLEQKGLLEFVKAGTYRLTTLGFEIAEKAQELEEMSKPTEITLTTSGSVQAPILNIKSNRVLALVRLAFLTSSEASVATQELSDTGVMLDVAINYSHILTLSNLPRIERTLNGSGPGKLRLEFRVNGRLEQVTLDVMLQPKSVNNTSYITITGTRTFSIPS